MMDDDESPDKHLDDAFKAARLNVQFFLLDKNYDNLVDSCLLRFDDLLVELIFWTALDKPYTHSINTIEKELKSFIQALKEAFPNAAKAAGYTRRYNERECLNKFRRSHHYTMLKQCLNSIFGDPVHDIDGPKMPLYTADIRDYLVLSSGLGVWGLRTLAFLHALMCAKFGPRPGSWAELTMEHTIRNDEGIWTLLLMPNKRRGNRGDRRKVVLDEEASLIFDKYMECREFSVCEKELTPDGVTRKVFFNDTDALTKSLRQCAERAGFGQHFFSGHSQRVGCFTELILKLVLNDKLSFEESVKRGVQVIGWHKMTTAEKYYTQGILKRIGAFKEANKTFEDITLEDRHPTLGGKLEPRRVARLCNNDGFPVPLRKVVTKMMRKIHRAYKPLEGMNNEDVSFREEYKKLTNKIQIWLFTEHPNLDDSVWEAVRAIESHYTHLENARRAIVNLLIRHKLLRLEHMRSSKIHEVTVPEDILKRLRLRPVTSAFQLEPETTLSGTRRKRKLSKLEMESKERPKKRIQLYKLTSNLNTTLVKAHFEGRCNLTRAPEIPNHDLEEIWPLGLLVRQQWYSEALNEDVFVFGIVDGIYWKYNSTRASYETQYTVSIPETMRDDEVCPLHSFDKAFPGQCPQDMVFPAYTHNQLRLHRANGQLSKFKYVVPMKTRVKRIQLIGNQLRETRGKVCKCRYLLNEESMIYTIKTADGVKQDVDEHHLIKYYILYK